MITILKSAKQGLETITDITAGCWVHVDRPTPDELARLKQLKVPPDFLRHALDPDERARIEHHGDGVLIVLRFPHAQGGDSEAPYGTFPLSLIVTEAALMTVSPKSTNFLQTFTAEPVEGLSTAKKTSFALHLIGHNADQYLKRVREINTAVDRLEDKLQHSLRNKEVLELLKYQKSLVYFTTALESNELVLERLQKGELLKRLPEDEVLLEDMFTEVRQAMEMTRISENILSQMMDAFASIISNNLNMVMKFLASITIVLTVPMLIASFYGMNVALPGEAHPWAFAIILGVCVLISAVILWVFRLKDWL